MPSKQKNNLSALGKKISYKEQSGQDKFDKADAAMEAHAPLNQSAHRVTRKSYALTKQDLESLDKIKDKCLDHKVVLSDSHIIRLAINLTSKLSAKELVAASFDVPKIPVGRPRQKEK